MCELIARMGADPDVLPRTSNFGVDYIAFSAICLDCPADFIQLAFNCVRVSFSLNHKLNLFRGGEFYLVLSISFFKMPNIILD